MSDPRLKKSCAGGCGTEVEIPKAEVAVWTSPYPYGKQLRWWCQLCADRVESEAVLLPFLDALTRNPALAAKVRKALEEAKP